MPPMACQVRSLCPVPTSTYHGANHCLPSPKYIRPLAPTIASHLSTLISLLPLRLGLNGPRSALKFHPRFCLALSERAPASTSTLAVGSLATRYSPAIVQMALLTSRLRSAVTPAGSE